MKKKIIFYILLVSFFTLCGCKYIICPPKNLPNLGNRYRLESLDCQELVLEDSSNTIIVDSYILGCDVDSTFIILCQRPWDSIPYIKEMKYSDANKAFERSDFKQYWIINKKEPQNYSLDSINFRAKYSNVYGPYKEEEYHQKRKEFGISENLKLIKTDSD